MRCCLWKHRQIQTKMHQQRCDHQHGLAAVIELCVLQVSFGAWLVYFGDSLDASLREVVLSTLERSVQILQMATTRSSRKMFKEVSPAREPVKPPERKVWSFAPRKKELSPKETALPCDSSPQQSPDKPPKRKVITFAPRKKQLPPRKMDLPRDTSTGGSSVIETAAVVEAAVEA